MVELPGCRNDGEDPLLISEPVWHKYVFGYRSEFWSGYRCQCNGWYEVYPNPLRSHPRSGARNISARSCPTWHQPSRHWISTCNSLRRVKRLRSTSTVSSIRWRSQRRWRRAFRNLTSSFSTSFLLSWLFTSFIGAPSILTFTLEFAF